MSVNFTPELKPYKETGSFKFWCQKVLPLVYDDSLSYYELLCKVVQYLNDVIENVDGLHDDIVALTDAYNQLQEYVNNYFDNLDVQEEINNKLDVMAADGTLSNVIKTPLENWLNEHITTSPVVDKTLTISGAAADAKVTGDRIKAIETVLQGYNTITIDGTIYRIEWKKDGENLIINCVLDLDTPAYENYTYRQIFIDNNLIPKANFENGLEWITTSLNDPIISTEKYNSPTHGLKCFSSASCYVKKSFTGAENGTYFIGINVSVSSYNSGLCGLQLADGTTSINAYYTGVTDYFVRAHGQGVITNAANLTSYIGNFTSASAEAYFDDGVILNMTSLFETIPETNIINKLYDNYCDIIAEKELNKQFVVYGEIIGKLVYDFSFGNGSSEFEIIRKSDGVYLRVWPQKTDVYYGLTLENIFETHNIAKSGNMENGLNWATTQYNNPVLTTDEYLSPTHSLYCSGKTSCYIGGSFYPSVDNLYYFVGVAAKCTRHASGIVGVSTAWNGQYRYESIKTLNGEWEGTGILFNPGTSGYAWYAGNISGADADAYFDQFVIIQCDMVFGENLPSEQSFVSLYNLYLASVGEYSIDYKIADYLVEYPHTDCINAFLSAMQDKADDIGMTNTVVATPDGLGASNMFTAQGLNQLITYCSSNNILAGIWGQKTYTVKTTGLNPREIEIETTVTDETFEASYHILGGKTGTLQLSSGTIANLAVIATDDSGRCFCGAVMNAQDRWGTMKTLFDKMVAYADDSTFDPYETPITDSCACIGWQMPMFNTANCKKYIPNIIYQKDSTTQNVTASTIKMLNIITALDWVDMHDRFTIDYYDIKSGTGKVLEVGDSVSIIDLIYLCMLPSSNTAATALAHHVGNIILNDKNA